MGDAALRPRNLLAEELVDRRSYGSDAGKLKRASLPAFDVGTGKPQQETICLRNFYQSC